MKGIWEIFVCCSGNFSVDSKLFQSKLFFKSHMRSSSKLEFHPVRTVDSLGLNEQWNVTGSNTNHICVCYFNPFSKSQVRPPVFMGAWNKRNLDYSASCCPTWTLWSSRQRHYLSVTNRGMSWDPPASTRKNVTAETFRVLEQILGLRV